MKRLRRSIRLKLTIATLAPLVTAITVCWGVGSSIITTRFADQALRRVDISLNSAHEFLLGEQARLSDVVRLTSQIPELTANLRSPARNSPLLSLRMILRNERLSFLTLVDRFGYVRYRATNPSLSGDSRNDDKLVSNALNGKLTSGISIVSAQHAARENPLLPGLMGIRLQPTPHAHTFTKQVEDRGMFLVASAPVFAADGSVLGAIYGGVLMNNDNHLVDRITRVVFPRDQEDHTPPGNATIFLDQARIATTVLDEQGKPAIGSLMSDEVFATILQGIKSIGRAFVFREYYFTAYEPLLDLQGKVVGAIYVGMPELPLMQLRSQVNLVFYLVLLVVTIIGTALSAWLGKNMTQPVSALVDGVRRVAAGENLPDIHVDSHDEIAELADEFNTMKYRLATREEENRFLNRTLEQRVVLRTVQLEEKNQQLLAAQHELAEAERLAAVGMLASGVCHEINNPLAIISGNAELLEMLIEPDAPGSEEVETIIRQAVRIEHIVHNLLTFSRSGLKRTSLISVGALLDNILDQVGHQVPLVNGVIERDYKGQEVTLEGDENQLQQVFTNLILNGLQAMAGSGTLRVNAVLDGEGNKVSVTVMDKGPGINPSIREKLFTPFFSTKSGGTGLGLAISYGIIKDHGGEIRVSSEVGEGAVFVVTLPVRQQERTSAASVES